MAPPLSRPSLFDLAALPWVIVGLVCTGVVDAINELEGRISG